MPIARRVPARRPLQSRPTAWRRLAPSGPRLSSDSPLRARRYVDSRARRHVDLDPLDDRLERSAGGEDAAHTRRLQSIDVRGGDDPSPEDDHVARSTLSHLVNYGRKERVVGTAHDREPDGVDVLLDGCARDHFRRLMQTGVYDLETRI